VETSACRKFYIPPETSVSEAGLVHEKLKCSLRLSWLSEDLPYLGVWVDEGVYNSSPVAALEPTSGYYDSLERALEYQKVSFLQPGETRLWTLKIMVGDAER